MSSDTTLRASALAPARTQAGQVDGVALRRAFGRFPSGVVAVAALTADGPVGMSASSFCSVSLDPPLVAVCVRNSSATWPALRRSPRLGLSVLASDQDALCRRLAGPQEDRFTGLSWEAGADGAIFIRQATAWLDCTVHDLLPGGDHTIVLLRVEHHAVDPSLGPLVFHAGELRALRSGVR